MTRLPKTVLFMAECVTLAHMVRPVVLAQSLAGQGYRVVLAADGRFDGLFRHLPERREKLHSISSARFLDALAKGNPLYDQETLTRYVEEDLAIIERTAPDLVVGDFRLSLSISARLRGIPYATVSNVYWSPFSRQRYPVPELPLTRLLGVPVAQTLFNLVRPLVFALHTIPLNRVRKRFGLPSLGMDLRRIYTDADLTLYADVPDLIATDQLPAQHCYIGPILWSPEVSPPPWWDRIDGSRPLIYLTPGSSGGVAHMAMLVQALAGLPVTVLVATAGRWRQDLRLPNVFSADFLPGEAAAAKADIVICNGGSLTSAQALAAGVPVIGIPSNLDQYLNMAGIEKKGAGILLRSGQFSPDRLVAAVRGILEDVRYRQSAEAVKQRIDAMSADRLFREALAQWF